MTDVMNEMSHDNVLDFNRKRLVLHTLEKITQTDETYFIIFCFNLK